MMTRRGRAALVAVFLLVSGNPGCDGEKNAKPGIVNPDRSTLAASPGAGVANGLFIVTLTATARDAAGSPLSGRHAVFLVSGIGNVLSPQDAVTDANGNASVELTSSSAESKEVQVTLDGVAVVGSAFVPFLDRFPSISRVAVGAGASLVVREDGSLWAWGSNSYGQLGDGTTVDRLSPVRVGSGYVSVAAGGHHTLALKVDGTLWAWGSNGAGQLGDGTTEARLSPVQVGSGFGSVTAGYFHSAALKTDGTLWAWGTSCHPWYPCLPELTAPEPVEVGSGFSSAASGYFHTLAVKANGTLWAWGSNWHGQLGDGTAARRSSSCRSAAASSPWPPGTRIRLP